MGVNNTQTIPAVQLPAFTTLEEARQIVIQQLQGVQRQLASPPPVTNYNGSRITNVGFPLQLSDAVTLGYLKAVLVPQFQGSLGNIPTPRVSSGTTTTTTSQAGLAALAASWGAIQTGDFVWVSDFAHILQWSGSSWSRGAGDLEHSDTFHDFGAAPSDTGWHACDGGTVTYLQYNGTLGTRVLPNTAGTSAYAKHTSGYSGTITPAVTPAVSVSAVSGNESADTIVVTGTSTVTVTVAAAPHTHTITALGTATLGGDPISNYSILRYYRR